MFCLELSVLLHRALEARVQDLMNDFSNAGWQEDPEGVHDVRVASRRVRAVLDLVEPDLYPGHKRQARKLKGLTRALGRTREMDVHAGILADLGQRAPDMSGGPAMEYVLEVIEARRRKARRAMAEDLARISLKSLPRLLLVASMPDPFRTGDLRSAIRACLEPWLAGAFPAEPLLDQDDPRALHALRIRVKRLRYALEILAPGFAAPPEAQLKHLRVLQTVLGDHHDRATLEALLADLLRGLEERGRPCLAAGVREILTHLGEERLIAFEHFRALGVVVPRDLFIDSLWRDLGQEPRESDHP